MQPAVREDRPPFIQFETRPVENRAKSNAAGCMVYDDVDFVIITPQGSKDKIEKVAHEWMKQCLDQVREQRLPQVWYNHYKALYDAFKEGRELPVNGKPLTTWPAATPGQVKTLHAIGIRTVEDLANCNEETVMRMGMGGRALKQLAFNWLAEAKEVGGAAMRLTQLEAENTALKASVASLSAQVQALAGALPQGQPAEPPARSSTEIAAADLIGDD